MASIDEGPTPGWIPAGQKLLFTLVPDGTVNDAYRYIVQVEENGTIISKIYLTPNFKVPSNLNYSLVEQQDFHSLE